MGPFLDTFFARLGWDRTEIDHVVPHQASRLGVSQCTVLGLPAGAAGAELADARQLRRRVDSAGVGRGRP